MLLEWLGSPVAPLVKNPPVMQEIQETRVPTLGQGDPLEKEMATHSSVLTWRIPRTEEPGGHSPWGHKVGHDLVTKPPTTTQEHTF